MDTEYDRKFEEMKKYIPFLESMIKRLENSSTVSNPRQAQLDKIRSLRDLLLDKKKRMKMENLLKCEQVLVNLYAKVEQRDPGPKGEALDKKTNEKSDLNVVRKKLKSAVSKLQPANDETLPEIARASVTEEVCVPGSKEPALFQRRPNIPVSSHFSPTRNKEYKRNYTRVLQSPETSHKRWIDTEKISDQPLFCRRSPKKSTRVVSPTYYKKERRKSKNKSKDITSKDLNITLNVPEESLNSLNTKDILSRIINCSDNDVDIDTLRELRTQILGELKDTGAKDDISDIILKSYKKTGKKILKNREVEEGELSDSESEAIESIYGSLVIMDKEKSTSETMVKASDTESPRKIQICLVINADKNKSASLEENCKSIPIDISEFETYVKRDNNSNQTELVTETKEVIEQIPIHCNIVKNANFKADLEKTDKNINILLTEGQAEVRNMEQENETTIQFPQKKDVVDPPEEINKFSEKNHKPNLFTSPQDHKEESNKDTSKDIKDKSPDIKTISEVNNDSNIADKNIKSEFKIKIDNQNKKSNTKLISTINTFTEKKTTTINDRLNKSKQKPSPGNPSSCDKEQKANDDIPLLEPTENVSEIDILQALKKEILNETTSVLGTESITPPLHQPKVTKVVNAQEIGTKKRISIESYKAKSNTSTKSKTSNDNTSNMAKDEVIRKQSLKLTEKECERFNLSKLSFAESSEDEDLSNVLVDNKYCNLAPKSPDHEDFPDTGLKSPVIIPSDPVKTTVVSSETDIDMRKLVPNLQMNSFISNNSISPSFCKEDLQKTLSAENDMIKGEMPLLDPRIKRETSCVPESPNSYLININNMQKRSGINYNSATLNLNKFQNANANSPSISNPNATPTRVSMISPNLTTNIPQHMPNLTPNMTPIRNMTPNARTYDLTPSRQVLENDNFSSQKHVYTPIFQTSELRDHNENQRHQWDKHDTFREDVDLRGSSVQRDIDYRDPRSNSIQRDNKTFEQYQMGSRNDRFLIDSTPSQSFVRLECPPTPNASFGRLDCPSTPTPSFGRIDCPSTPIPSFGRIDCPNTPTPSFGRMVCPNTPTPSFGRMECPNTPTPSFGRIDCPMTPIPSFGRSECPPTPNHPFGRPEPFHGTPFIRPDFSQPVTNQNYGEPQVPRVTRGSDCDKYYVRDDDRGRNYFQERIINKDSYKSEQSNCHSNSEHYRKFQREQSVGRNERNKNYDQNVRNYLESNRSFNRDYESDRKNSKNRGSSGRNNENRHQNEFKKYDDYERRNFQRERSIGRKESACENFSRSRNRDPSEGRTFRKENNLSINHHVDSFTIDTSVNRTFQSTERNCSLSFDARRQRAASVGRTLISDCKKDNNTKNRIITSTSKEQNSKLRRACSVGREIKNSKLDFKDIKEDLKSFKLKDNIIFSKGHGKAVDSHKATELKNTYESRSRKEIYDNSKSIQNNTKYLPKKNNRDPRMRRDNLYKRKEKHRDDYRSYSNDRKKIGIVYSNDNISKGNILGPGYGVKNYKIPKIKRAQDEKDASPCSDVQSKNIKDKKIINNSLKSVEEKDSNLKFISKKNSNQNNKQPNTVQVKKNITSSSNTEEVLKKTECESTVSKGIEEVKNNTKYKQDSKIVQSDVEVHHLKILEKNDATTDSEIILENSDKRVTRSVSRNIHDKALEQLDTSPLKRTRNIKKHFIYQSESDENEHEISLTSANNSNIQELTSNNVNFNTQPVLDDVKNDSETQKKSIISHEAIGNEENIQNHTLDNSFGIDDLEMFSENVVSDPVIDKINALIADLDHDIDSAKTVDNNFTKELSLETMLENITSSEECNNMEASQDINDLKTNALNPVKDTLSTSYDTADLENTKKIIEVTSADPSGLVNKIESNVDSEDKKDNEDLKLENKKASEIKPSETVFTETDNAVNDIDVEHIRTNDAIVSTSGVDNSNEKMVLDKGGEPVLSSQSTPDSTINSKEINENSQKSVPDSTNDSQCEMNSDITSTHNTIETLNMNLSESSSSHTASVEIETFGKLLSILQDKSKIKELLGLLGDSSTENEKIKRKLEKLSEIASDDEDTVSEKVNVFKTDSKNIEGNQNDVCDEAKKDDKSNKNSFPSDEFNDDSNDDSDSAQKDKEKIKSISENTLSKQTDCNDIVGNENLQVDNDVNEINTTDTANLKEKLVHLQVDIDVNERSTTDTANSKEELINLQVDIDVNERSIPDNSNSKEELVNLNKDSKNTKQENDGSTSEIITGDAQKNTACNDHDDANSSNIKDIEILEPQKMAPGGGKTKKKKNKFNTAKKGKRKNITKSVPKEEKRLTRSDVATLRFEKSARKKPTELQKLQDDIREMFLNEKDDILSTGVTGIRMCRLAKLVDERRNQNDEQTETGGSNSSQSSNQGPVVVLEKFKDFKSSEEISQKDTSTKKRMIKGKRSPLESDSSLDTEDKLNKKNISNKSSPNIKSSYKAKTKINENADDIDPYAFENEAINELKNTSNIENYNKCSESESESAVSLKSFGSTELLTEVKNKIKRKRVSKGWKAGIIKSKNRKKKVGGKNISKSSSCEVIESQSVAQAPVDCFTDKTYCFVKSQSCYDCRLCTYRGKEIVHHYKKQHPHSEIPLSRMSSSVAKEAIEESEKLNFQVICKVSSKKYVCRFCFEKFANKKLSLEAFFWHIVSVHTGEYKQLCSECLNVTRCPFNLDIPPPPKEANGQLLGYICEKCNYTQISLENLKSHVILRHNDEETGVYTINLSVMTKHSLNAFLEKSCKKDIYNFEGGFPRLLRSSRSNQSFAESSDVKSDTTEESYRNTNRKGIENDNDDQIVKVPNPCSIQSKIIFENENTDEILSFDETNTRDIKIEEEVNEGQDICHISNDLQIDKDQEETSNKDQVEEEKGPNDILDYPHFKIKYTDTGSKEYICCIKGNFHYKTPLLISLKKHVQLKHSEVWDGFCFMCKVIVTPQGVYHFKDCIQHYLDKHDNFPIFEEVILEPNASNIESDNASKENITAMTSYINVRPLSEMILKTLPSSQETVENLSTLPIIESVVSLGSEIEQSSPSPSCPSREEVIIKKPYKYEEAQAETMSKKHRVFLDAMMSNIKLVHVFKCAGRFCSFTTDSAEDALLHASTHARVGGVDSLNCAYCDYDASDNAIDLITHVFKIHGRCSYVCNLCFYRATTAHLVNAHIKRVHEKATNYQILHTSFQTGPNSDDGLLSREAAVPYYLCNIGCGTDAVCPFKSYTAGKLSKHYSATHVPGTELPCYMCPMKLSTPYKYVVHMRIHGLKLYHCVWCVYGSDSESGLLDHSSFNHPDKLPKAYLRIITNKEGTKEFRVLPLANLNKAVITSVEVASQNFKENPVKVAERSTELEKLISQSALMIESSSKVEVNKPSSNLKDDLQSSVCKEELSPDESSQLLLHLTKNKITPPSFSEVINKSEIISTLEIKSEEEESVANNSSQILPEVVCLDSDEESASQNVIDLSDDAPISSAPNSKILNNSIIEEKIVPLTELFLCAKCKMTFKGGSGFKKHITACYSSSPDPIPCAHCPLSTKKKDIVTHYTRMHSQRSETKIYPCPKCPRKLNSLAQVREHEKIEHSVISVSQPNTDASVKKPTGHKGRKRSLGSKEKVAEPPEKMKKFEPHEIHLLPINPILDDSVFCSLCEFSTKVRHNMVRHLQLHAELQPVPQTAPVNPVPHLETNEKHFDKMVNLASSSIVPRTDKSKTDYTPASVMIPPETASRYPKHIPEKHRLTCGAKGCSYISVDESMLKRHWEALHTGTNLFHCVHCPPYQHLDTSKSLTSSRVLAHLKMHDSNLYSCSLCSYYHYKREVLESHMNDVHKGGQVLIVREENSTVASSPAPTSVVAPTMDLKPWQCGVCKYKSLLRLEVVDHCAKTHNSKMQYKCTYCAFRASNSENITKHQSKSHVGKQEEIFYYYYQEGSVPDDQDGMPRWQKQSQKFVVSVKSETPSPDESLLLPIISQTVSFPQTAAPENQDVDLNLVKKEAVEATPETIENLCKEFGEFCEPNGLKYKCPLCKHIIEDTVEAMQSHLYEELKYRKWGCSICSYKAFHKTGLSEHMQIEHRQNREPVALQADVRIETWVMQLLEHQTALIVKNKENLAKQKEEIFRPVPGTPTKPPVVIDTPATASVSKKLSMIELEKTFGSFGAPVNMLFCCPKCKVLFKEESEIENHLENELNKIRWFCSDCFVTFQTYHEAQFHCRSAHMGMFLRPVEVIRDPVVRLSWVEAVIRVQKLSMNYVPLQKNITPETDTLENSEPENSLLIVRYEETVPTPEQQMTAQAVITPVTGPDSDDERLVIDEPKEPEKTPKNCLICSRFYSANSRVMRDHILRHYNLKPLICSHCNLMITRRGVDNHQRTLHPHLPSLFFDVQIPKESPGDYLAKQRLNATNKNSKVICLECQGLFGEGEAKTHEHNNVAATFGKKGDIVTKCAFCLTLHKDVNSYNDHHEQIHESKPKNYVFTKLKTIQDESRVMMYSCGNCTQKFVCMSELKVHVTSSHNGRLSYTIVPKHQDLHNPASAVIDLDAEEGTTNKRKANDDPLLSNKKIAKKSTTKLPLTKTCARKSTTKLPSDVSDEGVEFSYYGSRPETSGLDQVTAMMPFWNSVVPFSMAKLNEILNINPTVQVKKDN